MKEVKKAIAVLMLLTICLSLLPSCGKANAKMEGKTFTFVYARVGKGNEVRACASALSGEYEGVRTVDYTLHSAGGKLTVEGEGGTYTGEYKVEEVFDDSILYEINIGAEPGHASLTEETLGDGTVKYTLVLTIRGYFVTFTT